MYESRVKIISDFVDYYDYLADDSSRVVYKRMLSDNPTLVNALQTLRILGVKTIEIGTVRKLAFKEPKLIVYYDNKLGLSGTIVDSRNALLICPNYLASKLYDGYEISSLYRYLQIGKMRYCIKYSGNEESTIVEHIKELKPSYNKSITHPIFSIDYIATNEGMLAINFSINQKLVDTGIEAVLSTETIMNELYQRIRLNNIRGRLAE